MKYQQKLPVVDAVQWRGDNLAEVQELFTSASVDELNPDTLLIPTMIVGMPMGAMQVAKTYWALKDAGSVASQMEDHLFKQTYEEMPATPPE